MTDTKAADIPDRLWLCMADNSRTRTLSLSLARGMGMTVYLGPTVDPDGPIALMVVDDSNVEKIALAQANAAPRQKTIFVTAGNRRPAGADIVLAHDCDAGSLANAIEGLSAYREFELSTAGKRMRSLANTLTSGKFEVRTLDEARDLAVFLTRNAPRVCEAAVGLYVLLAAAIEHGNLAFTLEEKAEGLAKGNWNRRLAQRMTDPQYLSRRLHVEYARGTRLISLLVQDGGDGIDAETAEMANPVRAGYRGRGIKLARSLGFGELTWLGAGNTLATTILLPPAE